MRGRHLRDVALAAGALVWLTSPGLAGEQARTQAQRLQDAIQLVETKGDVRGAIPIFVEASKGPDRAVAALALLHLGDAYEKLGVDEARIAYLRIENDFKDQLTVVTEARARLRRLAAPSDRGGEVATFRRLWASQVGVLGPPSPDGKWLPVIDWNTGELCLRDPGTDETVQVTRNGQFLTKGDFPYSAAVSPDGKWIAYGYDSHPTDRPRQGELRVTTLAGAGTRTLLTREGADILIGGWTPDRREVLVVASTDVILVSVDSGASRVVARLSVPPTSASLSPDGRFVAYDVPQEGTAARDIVVRDVATGTEQRVIYHRANDMYPLWMPDGRRLVFASDRTGAMGIWRLDMSRGRGVGEPRLIHANVGRAVPIGLSAAGALYVSQLNGLTDVFMSTCDATTRRWSEPTPVSPTIVGSSLFPVWSPDSRSVAFTSRRSEVPFDRGSQTLVVHDIVSGDERELRPDVLGPMAWPAWSPDGRSIVVVGKRQQGLFRVDVASGAVTPLLEPSVSERISYPAWLPDGRRIIYSAKGQIRLRDVHASIESIVAEMFGSGFLLGASPSPDGRLIAFAAVGQAEPGSVRVVPVEGGEARTLATFMRGEVPEVAGWSPDSASVYYQRGTPGSASALGEVWSVPVAGGEPRSTGIRKEGLRDARLSPDGLKVAFAAGWAHWETWVLEHAIPVSSTGRRP